MIEIDNDLKYIFKYDNLGMVKNFLDQVNLTLNERKAIELTNLNGFTEKEASSLMNVAKRTIQNYRSSALKKIKQATATNEIAKEILNTRA